VADAWHRARGVAGPVRISWTAPKHSAVIAPTSTAWSLRARTFRTGDRL
jgi:hypothetical protein